MPGVEQCADWRETFRAIQDPIYLHDLDYKIVRANPAAVKLAGAHDERELIGRPYFQVFGLGAEPLPSCLKARQSAVPCTEEYHDGASDRWFGIDSHPVFDDQHAYVGAVHVHRDLTARKQLTAQLMQMDRLAAIGTLAAGVGHEINNPLTYVTGNVRFALEQLEIMLSASAKDELAGKELPHPSAAAVKKMEPHGSAFAAFKPLREALSDALEGCDRIAGTVRDLKTFSRASDDKNEWLDLHAQIDAAVALVSSQVRHKALITTDFGPLPKVWGNKGRLGQVFLNLLINAAQAIEEDAPNDNSVHVSTFTQGAELCVKISDTGCGIPDDKIHKIFNAFYTTKPEGQGTGLGLSICSQIATDHKGRIEVSSQVGKGSCFSLWLPMRTPTGDTNSPPVRPGAN